MELKKYYILQESVKNPGADRRTKRYFDKVAVWPKGLIFRVEEYYVLEGRTSEKLAAVNSYACRYGNVYRHDEGFHLLMDKAKELKPGDHGWSRELWNDLAGTNYVDVGTILTFYQSSFGLRATMNFLNSIVESEKARQEAAEAARG